MADEANSVSIQEALDAAVSELLGGGEENPSVQPEGQGEGKPKGGDTAPADVPAEAGGENVDGSPKTLSEDDVPTSYFGVDLSDLPPEKRAEIIEASQKQDHYVQKLQQRLKELEANPPKPEESEAQTLEMPSDEELAKALGFDPEDPLYEVKAETALPLAKEILSIRAEMEEMKMTREFEEFENHWNSTLDQMESEYGKLPVDRESFIDWAIEQAEAGHVWATDPKEAFLKFTEPQRTAASKAVDEQRKALIEQLKREASGVRPNSSRAEGKVLPDKPTIEEALKAAQDETGITIESILQGS